MDRIVITGIGVVSPIGNDLESFWRSCLAGRSGAVRLQSPWVSETDLSTKIACIVRDLDPPTAGLSPRQVKLIDRTTLFALVAAAEALADAGFTVSPDPDTKDGLRVAEIESHRFGTVVGSGIGGLSTTEVSHAAWRENRSKGSVKRYSLPMLIPNAPAAQVAIRFGLRAECKAISTACAAGTMALGDAWRLLASGQADAVLAGGAEGFARDEDAYGLMGFDRLRTMSTRNDEPERASRPFDLKRDGFVLGEGSGFMVLEREGQARARGARPYAVVAGYASNCDATSMMQLEATGERIVALIRDGLCAAGLAVDDVRHVSAHGTSTQLNDRTEALAFRKAFGRQFGDVSVTALKSMTGHGIAASGAMEVAALALSFRDGVLAPTINYEFPDPECDVNLVANEPRREPPRVAVKLSYGFGGHNACLVLTEP